MQNSRVLLLISLYITCNQLSFGKAEVSKQENADNPAVPNIYFPGPDTANFPNSPYTLPEGRSYFENYPLSWRFEGPCDQAIYNWFFLLRYGLTNNIEFRFLSHGLTKLYPMEEYQSGIGFSPLIFGFKFHLFGKEEDLWIPAFGVECYIQTNIATDFLKEGNLPILNFLFKHHFPHEWFLEWNAGMYGRSIANGINQRNLYGLIEWALEKDIYESFQLFAQGYYATPYKPYLPSELVVGVGSEVNPNRSTSVYGSVNWSLLSTGNPVQFYLGCAFAY